MRDYFFNKRLNFHREFNICPTHYIMDIEAYKKAQLLLEYVPKCHSKYFKETLFGLEIIVADICETKCAVLL